MLIGALLVGCSAQPYRDSAPRGYVDVSKIPDAIPKDEPRSQYGNPNSYEQFGRTYHVMESSKGFVERGVASWYGTKFHGRRTSSGEDYNMYSMTAAHKTLPLPTYLEVTNLDNGKQVVVRVNDRGPFHDGRIIDLSYAAAIKLGINKHGTGRVEIRALQPGEPRHMANEPPPALTIGTLAPSTIQMTAIESTPIQAEPIAAEPIPTAIAQTQPVAVTLPSRAPDPGEERYLQVGAFSSLVNAENLRKRLSPVAQTPIRIVSNADPKQPVYRVRIGPLNSDEAAQQLAARLADAGINNSSVVFD